MWCVINAIHVTGARVCTNKYKIQNLLFAKKLAKVVQSLCSTEACVSHGSLVDVSVTVRSQRFLLCICVTQSQVLICTQSVSHSLTPFLFLSLSLILSLSGRFPDPVWVIHFPCGPWWLLTAVYSHDQEETHYQPTFLNSDVLPVSCYMITSYWFYNQNKNTCFEIYPNYILEIATDILCRYFTR